MKISVDVLIVFQARVLVRVEAACDDVDVPVQGDPEIFLRLVKESHSSVLFRG